MKMRRLPIRDALLRLLDLGLHVAIRREQVEVAVQIYIEKKQSERYNVGQAYARLGRRADAQEYLDRAEQLQDDLEAIEYWQSLAKGNPDQLMLWVKLAQALRRAGRESQAREADRLALSLAPRYMVHEMSDAALAMEHRRAGLALVNGDAAGSVERYRALLDRNAGRPDIWFNLGVVYAATGQ